MDVRFHTFMMRLLLGSIAIFIVVFAGMSFLLMIEKNAQPIPLEPTTDCSQYLFTNANKTENDAAQLDIVWNLRRDYIEEIHIIKVYNDSYPPIAVGKNLDLSRTPIWYFSSGVTTEGRVQDRDTIKKTINTCWSHKQ